VEPHIRSKGAKTFSILPIAVVSCSLLSSTDVWLHTKRGYPQFNPADQEDIALQWAEAIFLRHATTQRGPSARPHIRAGGHELGNDDADDGDGEPIHRVPPSVPQARQ